MSPCAAEESVAQRADAAVLAALDERLDFDFQETPLAEVADFISTAANINVDLDQPALEEVGIGLDTPIRFQAKDLRLASALRLMLREIDLAFDVRDGALLITTAEEIESELITRVYPIAELLEFQDHEAFVAPDDPLAALIDVVTSTVRSTTWHEVGGVGNIHGYGAALVVSQTRDVHEEVADLLSTLAAAFRIARSGGPPEALFLPQPHDGRSADEANIFKALDQPAELDCTDKPLAEVIDELASRAGVAIRVDRKALEEVGIGADTPVTRSLKGISLRSLLRLTLKELDLTYVVRDDVLQITTPEECECELVTRIFPVADLLRGSVPDESLVVALEERGMRELKEVITSTTREEVGGPGAIASLHDCLVISQTQDVLDEVAPLIAGLRKMQSLAKEAPDGVATEILALDEVAQPVLVELRAKLDGEVGMLAFQGTPLAEVMEALAKKCGVEIQFDHKALEEVGAGTDRPISASFGGESLGQALRRLLRGDDLQFVLRDEVVLITTPEEIESELLTRLYPVGDLVQGHDSFEPRKLRKQLNVTGDYGWEYQSNRAAAYDELIETIVSTIEENGWECVGGAGAIEEFPPAATLVISQTRDVHDQIAVVLAEMRKHARTANAESDASDARSQPAALKDKSGARLHLVVYKLKSPKLEDAQAIAETIRELVEPESWKSGEPYYLRALTGAVIVRHTAKAHRAIHALLSQLDVLGRPGGLGGGLGGAGGGLGGGAPVRSDDAPSREVIPKDNGLGGAEFGRGTGFGEEAEAPPGDDPFGG